MKSLFYCNFIQNSIEVLDKLMKVRKFLIFY